MKKWNKSFGTLAALKLSQIKISKDTLFVSSSFTFILIYTALT